MEFLGWIILTSGEFYIFPILVQWISDRALHSFRRLYQKVDWTTTTLRDWRNLTITFGNIILWILSMVWLLDGICSLEISYDYCARLNTFWNPTSVVNRHVSRHWTGNIPRQHHPIHSPANGKTEPGKVIYGANQMIFLSPRFLSRCPIALPRLDIFPGLLDCCALTQFQTHQLFLLNSKFFILVYWRILRSISYLSLVRQYRNSIRFLLQRGHTRIHFHWHLNLGYFQLLHLDLHASYPLILTTICWSEFAYPRAIPLLQRRLSPEVWLLLNNTRLNLVVSDLRLESLLIWWVWITLLVAVVRSICLSVPLATIYKVLSHVFSF